MTNTRRALGILFLSGSLGAAVVAQSGPMLDVKLGLWEMTAQMTMGGGAPPNIDMSKLTPEQQAAMAAMMQSRGMGMTTPPTVTKMCMTREKLATHKFTPDRPGTTCKEEVTKSTATSLDVIQDCKIAQPPGETHNEVHIEALSPTSIKLTGNMTSAPAGRGAPPQKMTMASTGKWLGADCGDVK